MTNLSRRTVLAGLAGASATALAAPHVRPAGATPGVTDTEILLGQTMPYSGGASGYADWGRAEVAYFEMINAQGGINGRHVRLISLDDGLSPPKTVEQTRRMVERDGVLALFGSFATSPNSAIHRYVNSRGVPHLFLASGASKWADPENYPWTMGWLPDYPTEAKVYAQYIMENDPDATASIFYQNDDGGRDFYEGFKAGFGDQVDRYLVGEQTFEATDPTVDAQIANLQQSGANYLFIIGQPRTMAQAIRGSYDSGWRPNLMINAGSASVSGTLEPAGLDKAAGIMSVAFVKDPTDDTWADDPGFLAWSAFMDEWFPKGRKSDVNTVYGYCMAQTMEQVLRQCGDDLSRENVMAQAANLRDLALPMLLPGVTINTAPDDYRPIEAMRLQRFNGAKWELFGDTIGG
ncbi:MAG: ABC transporter substrate-binding protein [Roseitalea sp.]|jgi:ABC-type branched-subunit amino acid transport system substrate-binding protein|nr:ABC transporter substrate-binding protein [Roseitalea sp.]MBO6722057.1 ABC transporter substrate-binding protein [Roseitalea sp.]MBO6741677.1 ABC transporter substrate-binding protein [Roseitalea sp.]